jgi:hypothetical protein
MLVGGFNHLEKYEFVSWEGCPPVYEMENKKCLKPPTRYGLADKTYIMLLTVAGCDNL